MFVLSISAVLFATAFFIISRGRAKQPNKIFNVYSQPGRWFSLKYYVFLVILMVRRVKYYFVDKTHVFKPEDLEKLQALSDHDLACDAVFFHFVSQNGIYYCSGIERRQQGKCSGLIYLVLPEYGILCNKKLPSTVLDADPGSLFSMEYFGAEGISFRPVEPMKKWQVSYKGKMKQESNPQNVVDVDLEGTWQSDYPWILFEVDTPAHLLATSFATEEWSKEYFEKLKEIHQSHYEQMGFFSGKLKVNGKVYELDKLDAFRDHSFAFKRDWSIMHRYIYHIFYLKDSTRISVGVISQPYTSSNMLVGFVTHPNRKVDMIDECDLKLYQHGENGTLPSEICFTVTANYKAYVIQVKYLLESVHFKGREQEARMHERFLKCIVNGVPGRGISEWHYNNNNE